MSAPALPATCPPYSSSLVGQACLANAAGTATESTTFNQVTEAAAQPVGGDQKWRSAVGKAVVCGVGLGVLGHVVGALCNSRNMIGKVKKTRSLEGDDFLGSRNDNDDAPFVRSLLDGYQPTRRELANSDDNLAVRALLNEHYRRTILPREVIRTPSLSPRETFVTRNYLEQLDTRDLLDVLAELD